MRTYICGTVLGMLGAAAVSAAQAPPRAGGVQDPAAVAAPAYEEQLITVEGCVRRERAPDPVALEVSGDPDSNAIFVLASAEVRSRLDTVPAPSQGEAAAVEGTKTPAATRYLIAGLPDDRLKLFAGQRVVLTGQFEPPVAAVSKDVVPTLPAGTSGATRRPANLPRFIATSIKPTAGICTPKP